MNFLKEKHYELKNEVSIKADYFPNGNMEYSVRCQVMENQFPLIDLTITVPSEAEAQTVANNWNKKKSGGLCSHYAKPPVNRTFFILIPECGTTEHICRLCASAPRVYRSPVFFLHL